VFTGLVDDVGIITAVAETAAGREFRIACAYRDLEAGESIACNGACLTVRVITTLGRTTLETWRVGDRVNLERALRAGDRLGGHIVQGHVDGVAEVVRTERAEDALLIELALPPGLADLMVPHGSITVDGVSLTVNALPAPDRVELSLIEYTLRHTTLGALSVGSRVHVEGDIIGKYVRRLAAPYALEQG
jgi:riboflavin synthase